MSDDVVWVRSDPSVDGSTYVVSVEFSDDRANVLDPDRALRYASTVLAAAQRAEYDAAVFKQLRTLVDFAHAVSLINDLRKDRAPLDQRTLAPMALEPGVNSEGEPFLALSMDGTQVGQWTVDDARGHAHHVLEAIAAADLDAAYYRALTGVVGLDCARARNVVADLLNHRPETSR